MQPLTAAQHRRRQIIFGIVLTIAIPIVNSFLSHWGLPSIPIYVQPAPIAATSSGATSALPDAPPDSPFFADQETAAHLIQCSRRGFSDGGETRQHRFPRHPRSRFPRNKRPSQNQSPGSCTIPV